MQPLDYTRFSLCSPDQKSLAYFKPRNGVWTVPTEGEERRGWRLVSTVGERSPRYHHLASRTGQGEWA